MTTSWEATADLVVAGAGVAGLTAAHEAMQLGLRVLVVAKGPASDGNTRWAQGGVAAVLPGERDPHDSVHRHIQDTLAAGAGLCDADVVRSVLTDGADAVARLRAAGAVFDTDPLGRLARTREGGHTARRVIHAGGDATGDEVQRALLASVHDGGLTILERHTAVGLQQASREAVVGIVVLDPDGITGYVRAPAVLLATGGTGHLYQATTNPEVATADGIGLALRAGADVADLEFVQFHPTVLYTPADRGGTGRRPLVTEAVRGEGAVLVDATGRPIMNGVHPQGDLAPRDVVSAAINRRLKTEPGGVADHVYLDATHLTEEHFRVRFPTVFAACQAAGLNPAQEPIPVAPAAHFACGGVVTTVDGRTSVPGLHAVGEVARTGLHGANRLASNSLLEGLVTGRRVARAVAADLATGRLGASSSGPVMVEWTGFDGLPTLRNANRAALQQAMSRHAAIGRHEEGLAAVSTVLGQTSTAQQVSSRKQVEDAALDLVARALIAAALERRESRGCHIRPDYDRLSDRWGKSIVVRMDGAGDPTVTGMLALADDLSAAGGSRLVHMGAA